MSDELVASFVSITGADAKTAEGLLEVKVLSTVQLALVYLNLISNSPTGLLQACNEDLDSAVQLFFETQAGPSHFTSDAELASSLHQQSSRPGSVKC